MTDLPVKRSIKIISVLKDVARKELASQKESIESQNFKKSQNCCKEITKYSACASHHIRFVDKHITN